MATALAKATDGGAEKVNTVASSGASLELDLADGNIHDVTLDANCTITFTAFAHTGAGVAHAFTLILRQDGTGSRTVTWPGSVDWPEGTEPTLTTTASAVDVITFLSVDDGTTLLGFVSGQDLK